MSPAADATALLRRLLADVQADAEALSKLAAEVEQVTLALSPSASPSRAELALLAVDLHGYYTALESIFERVARTIDRAVPEGASSHKALLDAMTRPLPGVRPAVIAGELRGDLHKLLGFRHFFRQAYAVDLDAEEILGHATRLARVHPMLERDLQALDEHLEKAIQAASDDGS